MEKRNEKPNLIESTKVRILSKKKMFQYSSASIGINLPLSIFTGFNFYYMVYVVGLNSGIVSIVTSLALLMNAVASPVFGNLSDNYHNKGRGKRRPFLLLGAPLLSITFFLLWFYPSWLDIDSIGEFGVSIIFLTGAIGFSIFNAFLWSPYIALLPEISTETNNRIQTSSIQGSFNLVATIVGIVFPFLIKGSFENDEIVSIMILVSGISVILIMVTILATYFSIREPIQDLIAEEKSTPSLSSEPDRNLSIPSKTITTQFKSIIADFKIPLLNRNFQWWILNSIIFNLAMKVPMTILLPYLENVLGIGDSELIVFIALAIPFAGLGYLVWIKLSSKVGLVKTMIIVYSFLSLLFVMSSILSWIFGSEAKIVGSLLIILIITVLIATFIIPNPLIANIIDQEVAVRNIQTEEEKFSFSGKFFGVHSFFLYVAQSIGILVLGQILQENETDPHTLIILLLISGLIITIALVFIRKIKLSVGNP